MKASYALFKWPNGTLGWWVYIKRNLAKSAVIQDVEPMPGCKFTGEILTEKQMIKRGFISE